MGFINSWVQGIIVAVVIATIIEMILPNGNNKKYVQIVIGMYVVFSIMVPIVNKITNNNFEISSIINIDKYKKQFETSETNSKIVTLENNNDKNIKEIYISNLKNDMKIKLKEKGYIAKEINITLKNDDTYEIQELTIKLDNNKINIENKEVEENKNINKVEEIKIDNISISNKEDKIDKKKIESGVEESSKITAREKTEIIKNISDVYGINEKNITIY